MRLFRASRAHRATTLLLVPLLAACNGPAEPVCDDGDDPQRIIMVRGRITAEDGRPIALADRPAIQGFTNYAPDCTGELWGDHIVHPDANGFYLLKVGSPKLLPPRRCVWVRANRANDVEFEPTGFVGGIPATLRFRCGGEPLDTLEINIVLKRRTE